MGQGEVVKGLDREGPYALEDGFSLRRAGSLAEAGKPDTSSTADVRFPRRSLRLLLRNADLRFILGQNVRRPGLLTYKTVSNQRKRWVSGGWWSKRARQN